MVSGFFDPRNQDIIKYIIKYIITQSREMRVCTRDYIIIFSKVNKFFDGWIDE